MLELGIGVLGLLILVGDAARRRHLHRVGRRRASFGIVFRARRRRHLPAAADDADGRDAAGDRALGRRRRRDGVSWLGFFYGGNIAGAVVGCLLAGFYLLRVYDMATATFVAVALNVAVALIALVLAGRTTVRSRRRDRAASRRGAGRAARRSTSRSRCPG